MMFVTYTLFAPIVGNLTDRIGGRKVIAFFCTILVAGVLLMSTVNRLITALLFLAIAAIGISATWTPVVVLNTRWFSANKRGFVLGVIALGSFVGSGILGLIYPLILARYNWRFGWIILGVLASGIAVVNGITLRSKPEDLGLLPLGEKGKSSEPWGKMLLVDTKVELKYLRRRCQNGKNTQRDLHKGASRGSSETGNGGWIKDTGGGA